MKTRKRKRVVSQHRAAEQRQPPPEKCEVNAWAKEPKPPRVTWLEPESDGDVPELLDEESPLKKLLRDDPPDEPWPPLDVDEPRGGHSALDGDAMPGWFGLQFSPGISA